MQTFRGFGPACRPSSVRRLHRHISPPSVGLKRTFGDPVKPRRIETLRGVTMMERDQSSLKKLLRDFVSQIGELVAT